MTTPVPRLWHYTCRDAAPSIDRDGKLVPNRHPWLAEPLVWLTDLDSPHRDGLGLTGASLACDRTEHRYEVLDAAGVVRWSSYARFLPRQVREALESAPGVLPAHWWVSLDPVPVRRADG